jgi:hypothetical protein
MTDLERAILKAVLAKGYTLNPMSYVQDGQYTDYDEWDSVNLGNGLEFDINFYSDGDYFYITAYDLIQTDSGLFIRNDSSFFHIYKTKLEGVVA